MSWGAVEWARTWMGELTSPQRFVLFMLADHYNEEHRRAWPSLSTLAKETALDRRTVTRSITVLEEKALVEIEHWVSAFDGSKLRNRYCLPLYDSRSVASPAAVRAMRGRTGEGKWEETPLPPADELAGAPPRGRVPLPLGALAPHPLGAPGHQG